MRFTWLRSNFAAAACLLAATAATVATASASTAGQAASESVTNFVLADAGGFTGFCAPYDLPALNGIRLAADQINATGGLLGRYPSKSSLATRAAIRW